MSRRYSPLTASLGLDQFEERVCLSSGPHSGDSLVAVLQTVQGPNATSILLDQYQQGLAAAKGLVQSAGADHFQHVLLDAQLVLSVAQSGVVSNIQREIGSRADAYARGDTSGAAALAASVDRGAFAAGFLRGLSDDFTAHAVADLSHLSSLGSTVVPALAGSIRSIDDTFNYIAGGINTTVGQSADDFNRPHDVHDFNEMEMEIEAETHHGGGHT